MALPNSIRNIASPITEGFQFDRRADDPDQGTATFVGAAYKMRLFNDSADSSSDVELTKDSGITVTSEGADTSKIKVIVTPAQLATLYSGAALKVIPNDPGNRKAAVISYTLQLTQIGYAASQGDDATGYTGKFYLISEAQAGR